MSVDTLLAIAVPDEVNVYEPVPDTPFAGTVTTNWFPSVGSAQINCTVIAFGTPCVPGFRLNTVVPNVTVNPIFAV